MANVNFGSFTPITPSGEDFLVGFRGASEIRTKVTSLTSLNQSTIDKVNNLIIDSVGYRSVYSTVSGLSSRWSAPYTYINTNSAILDNCVSVVKSNSANWGYAYTQSAVLSTAVTVLSSDVRTLSSTTYGYVVPNLNSIFQPVNPWEPTRFSQWNSTANYITLCANNIGIMYSTLIGNGANSPCNQNWYTWQATTLKYEARADAWQNLFKTVLGFIANDFGSSGCYTQHERTPILSSGGFKAPTWDAAYNWVNTYGGNVVLKTGDLSPTDDEPVFNGAVTTTKQLSTQFVYGNEFVTKLYVDAAVQTSTISGNFNPSLYYLASQLYTKTQTDAAINNLKTTYTLTSSNRWTSVWTNVQQNSSLWSGSYFQNLSGYWTDAADIVSENYIKWNTATDSVFLSSDIWNSVYLTVKPVSATASNTSNVVAVNSANWNVAYNGLLQVQNDISSISARGLFLDSNILEVTNNIVITNGNQSLYNGKILHMASDSGELVLTFGVNLPQNFNLSVVNLGKEDVLLLPNDGTILKTANYRIYGNQFATATFYKYKNYIYALGTVPPAR